ncbi:MAG: hypothetical protein EBZ93_02530 [Actinobacteria bacterium]|nr:hypothetical protein [Actinomycetota bacterium]
MTFKTTDVALAGTPFTPATARTVEDFAIGRAPSRVSRIRTGVIPRKADAPGTGAIPTIDGAIVIGDAVDWLSMPCTAPKATIDEIVNANATANETDRRAARFTSGQRRADRVNGTQRRDERTSISDVIGIAKSQRLPR